MVARQNLRCNTHKTGVSVVHLVIFIANIVDCQLVNLIIQLSSNLCNGSISAHSAVNGEQHGDSLIFPGLVGEITQHILVITKGNFNFAAIHIQSNIDQITITGGNIALLAKVVNSSVVGNLIQV